MHVRMHVPLFVYSGLKGEDLVPIGTPTHILHKTTFFPIFLYFQYFQDFQKCMTHE